MSGLAKRSLLELESMPKPTSPAELEVLSLWYFGARLHLSTLCVHESENGAIHAGTAQYQVSERYNDYHGKGFLHGECCIKGYDYSRDFWAYVIGRLYCGGIGGHSYGQTYIKGHRDVLRLKKFEGYLRRNESGRLRKSFERLAAQQGGGESMVTLDSHALTTGRVDGAGAVLLNRGAS